MSNVESLKGNFTQESFTSQAHEGRVNVGYQRLEVKDPKLKMWEKADYTADSYPEGTFGFNGFQYRYPEGRTLRIMGEPVMDTCEKPWAEATVRKLLESISGARTDMTREYEVPRILELGYGLGITSLEILRGLDSGIVTPGPRGGEYTVVELNEKLSRFAKNIISDRIKSLKQLTEPRTHSSGPKTQIDATVIQGDAYDALGKFAKEVKEGKRKPFDGIVSDLFDPGQADGTTDIKRLDLMREILADRGFLTFFVYHQGSTGSGTNRVQEQLLDEYGFDYKTDTVSVSPNPNYEYLFQKGEDGIVRPIRRLSTIICWKRYSPSPLATYK